MDIRLQESVDFELELERPDGKNLGIINAYGVDISLKSKDLSEMSFNLPEYIDRVNNGFYERVKNPFYSMVRENFSVVLYVKNKKNNNIILKKRFKLSKKKASTDGSKTTINWSCYSNESRLNNKKIIDFAGVQIDSDGNTNTSLINTGQVSVISGVNINATVKQVSVDNDYIPIDFTLDGLRVYEVIQSLLTGTNSSWSLRYIDGELEDVYRSGLSVNNTFLLEAINSVCDIFQAIPIFDHDEKTINIFKLTNLGLKNGLSIEYGKYLKTLSKDKSAEKLITRVRANGADGIGINGVTTTGQNYIEDYTYFLGSFERDAEGNIIKSSEWFSDGLSVALLDYFELVEEKEVIIRPLIQEIETITSSISEKEQQIAEETSGKIITETQEMRSDLRFYLSEEPILKMEDDITLGIGLVERINADGSFIEGQENVYNYDTKNDVGNIENGEYTMPLINKVVTIDGKSFSYTTVNVYDKILYFSGFNPTAGDILRVTYTTLGLTSINDSISSYTAYKVNLEEGGKYTQDEEERVRAALGDLYIAKDEKEATILSLRNEITTLRGELEGYKEQVSVIYDEISINNNFTKEEAEEWENYIVEGVYQNTNIDDQELLLSSAREYLEEKKFPETTIDTSVISILQTTDAEYDWSNIKLFDRVDILFERLDVNVTSQIYEINIDVDNYSMSLVISTVRDYLNGANDYIKEFFSKSARTSGSVDYNAPSWDNGSNASDELESIKNEGIDTGKYKIFSSIDNSVRIDGDGITIQKKATVDSNGNPISGDQGLIRMTNGLIELLEVGSESRTAITPKRIIADVIQGKLLVGNELEILGGDENTDDIIRGGIIPQANIVGANKDDFGLVVSGEVGSNIVKTHMTRDNGFGIDIGSEKVFGVNSSGNLTVDRAEIGSGSFSGFKIGDERIESIDGGGYITSKLNADRTGMGIADATKSSYINVRKTGIVLNTDLRDVSTLVGFNVADVDDDDSISGYNGGILVTDSRRNDGSTSTFGMRMISVGKDNTGFDFNKSAELYTKDSEGSNTSIVRWYYNKNERKEEIATIGSSTRFIKSNYKNLNYEEVQDFIDRIEIQTFDKYKKENKKQSIGFTIEQLEEDGIPFAKEIVGYNEYDEVIINKNTGYAFDEEKDKREDKEVEKRRSYDYDAMFGAILAVNKLQNKQIKELQEQVKTLSDKIERL